jgi:hypothetical protein
VTAEFGCDVVVAWQVGLGAAEDEAGAEGEGQGMQTVLARRRRARSSSGVKAEVGRSRAMGDPPCGGLGNPGLA